MKNIKTTLRQKLEKERAEQLARFFIGKNSNKRKESKWLIRTK